MPGDNFTFVGLSGQADLDIRATNKLVRSHVMRRYRRQQKATKPKEDDSPQSAEGESIPDPWSSEDFASLTIIPCIGASSTGTTWSSDLSAAFSPTSPAKQNTATREQQAASACLSPSSSIRTWLDGEMDPFSSLPINIDQRSHMLLQRSKCPKPVPPPVVPQCIHQQDTQPWSSQMHHRPYGLRFMQIHQAPTDEFAARIQPGCSCICTTLPADFHSR